MSSQTKYRIGYRTAFGFMLFVYLCLQLLSTGVVLLEWTMQPASQAQQLDQISVRYGFDWRALPDIMRRGTHSYVSEVLLLLVCLLIPLANIARAAVVVSITGLLLLGWYILVTPAGNDLRFAHCLGWLLVIWCAFVLLKVLEAYRSRRLVQAAVRKYAPTQLTEHYYANPEAIDGGGELRDLTIMFCDMHQFTHISERLSPDQLPGWLNQYFSLVSRIVEEYGGTVDKYMGDSVMAFWGAPGYSESHARDALDAGVQILAAIDALSAELVENDLPPIRLGIGIATGLANVGNLGAENRMTYTVVGDAVNIADRLQRETRKFHTPLIVNDTMTEQVPDYLFRGIHSITLKGRRRQVRIFDPVCHQDEATPDTHRRLQLHKKAVQFVHLANWSDAEKLFLELREYPGQAPFYDVYLQELETLRSGNIEPLSEVISSEPVPAPEVVDSREWQRR